MIQICPKCRSLRYAPAGDPDNNHCFACSRQNAKPKAPAVDAGKKTKTRPKKPRKE